jgi:hypothetical protein
MENTKFLVVEGDKIADTPKPIDHMTMAELTGRDPKDIKKFARVIYTYPDAQVEMENPNSLKNVFKRLLKK